MKPDISGSPNQNWNTKNPNPKNTAKKGSPQLSTDPVFPQAISDLDVLERFILGFEFINLDQWRMDVRWDVAV